MRSTTLPSSPSSIASVASGPPSGRPGWPRLPSRRRPRKSCIGVGMLRVPATSDLAQLPA
eukprot:9436734-Alexandrium_andersonii.AAC.1